MAGFMLSHDRTQHQTMITAVVPFRNWWAHQDSNLGQTGYEPAALTAELWALTV